MVISEALGFEDDRDGLTDKQLQDYDGPVYIT